MVVTITDSGTTLDEASALAADVQKSAEDALDRSDTNLMLLSILIVIIGFGTGAACFAGARAVRHLQREAEQEAADHVVG
jgi:hypothetical protein